MLFVIYSFKLWLILLLLLPTRELDCDCHLALAIVSTGLKDAFWLSELPWPSWLPSAHFHFFTWAVRMSFLYGSLENTYLYLASEVNAPSPYFKKTLPHLSVVLSATMVASWLLLPSRNLAFHWCFPSLGTQTLVSFSSCVFLTHLLHNADTETCNNFSVHASQCDFHLLPVGSSQAHAGH